MIQIIWPTITEEDDDRIWKRYTDAIRGGHLMAPAHTVEEAAAALEDAGLIHTQRRDP